MPKTYRHYLQRHMGYVLGTLDRVLEHALVVKGEFDTTAGLDPGDDDYLDQLTALAETSSHARFSLLLHTGMMATLQAQQIFEDVCKHAWGHLPPKGDHWREDKYDVLRAKKGE